MSTTPQTATQTFIFNSKRNSQPGEITINGPEFKNGFTVYEWPDGSRYEGEWL